MTQFNIDVVSDSVCPFCYVGKKKLDAAIATYKQLHPDSNDTFHTTWKPFYLNPNAPKEGVDKITYMKSRFGEDRAAMLFERQAQIGAAAGINFKFGGKTGNTRDSHRLVQLAKTKPQSLQDTLMTNLFSSYFENEGDITSWDELVKVAVRSGIEEKEAREWLESGKGGREVDEEVEEARRAGVTGVPNFTVQGRYEVGGAQDESVFLSLFERIKGEEGEAKA